MKNTNKQADTPYPEIVTIKQLAQILQVSVGTIKNHSVTIPRVRLGPKSRLVRYRVSEVLDALNRPQEDRR